MRSQVPPHWSGDEGCQRRVVLVSTSFPRPGLKVGEQQSSHLADRSGPAEQNDSVHWDSWRPVFESHGSIRPGKPWQTSSHREQRATIHATETTQDRRPPHHLRHLEKPYQICHLPTIPVPKNLPSIDRSKGSSIHTHRWYALALGISG